MSLPLSFCIPAYNEADYIGATIDAIHDAMAAIAIDTSNRASMSIPITLDSSNQVNNDIGNSHDKDTSKSDANDIFNSSPNINANPTYEIIVADDASTDDTAAIARDRGANVITVNNRQIAGTRNAAGRAAVGDALIFVDADTLVTAEAVRGALDAINRGAAGGGAAVKFDGHVPWHARLLLPPMMIAYRMLKLTSGAFVFCRRDVFERTGGFDETLFAGEEVSMARGIARCGKFVFVTAAVTTSGRKLRAYSARELYGTLFRLAVRGKRGVQQREGLAIWYGTRRTDPRPGKR